MMTSPFQRVCRDYLSVIDAQSIVDAIKDAFVQFQIPFTKLRGQCYDGCSTMTGARAGVDVKIRKLSLELCSHIAMAMHST